MVTFKNWKGERISVRFTGVVSFDERIVKYPDSGLHVDFLSKWEAMPPCYKYVFTNYIDFKKEESDYLAIVAQEFEIIEDGTKIDDASA